MNFLTDLVRFSAIPLVLLVAACVNETDDGNTKIGGTQKAYGRFVISLEEASTGYTSIHGKMTPKASPSPVDFANGPLIGGCRLITPTTPFCDPGCTSGFICVDKNQCQEDPAAVNIGKVTVTGLKTKKGTIPFDLIWVSKTYMASPNDSLLFPPFGEGDAVSFSSAGDSLYAGFTLATQGISPLSVLNDTITMADGKPMSLKWTAPVKAGVSTLTFSVDISHHGGLKGKIECKDVPDNGSFEIPATLVDQLKALGISGFPKIELTRIALGKSVETHAELTIESNVTRLLNIPGIISCDSDENCPTGQTCQDDLQCK